MAHSLSAKKRVRQNEKRRSLNRSRKSRVKTLIKRFEQAISSGNLEAAQQQYPDIIKSLDKVASQGTVHKKTAARKKSRLAKKLNNLVKAKKA